jgi:hypothetical protein
MKTLFRIGSIVLLGLLISSGTGCHKQAPVSQTPTTLQEGVANLRKALFSANQTVVSKFNDGVSYNIRYRFYPQAAQDLQAIADDPSLNDQQKKAVSDLSDLLKQAMAGQTNAAPAAP